MKEKIFKKGIIGKLFSVVLAFVMLVSLMPNMTMTVRADSLTAHGCSNSSHIKHFYVRGTEEEHNIVDYWILEDGAPISTSGDGGNLNEFTSKYGSCEKGKWYYETSAGSGGECDAVVPTCNCKEPSHKTHIFIHGVIEGEDEYVYFSVYETDGENVGKYKITDSLSPYGMNWLYSINSYEVGKWYIYGGDECSEAGRHTHGSWDYSVSGATLTATCGASGTCTLQGKKVSLTLSANNVNYSGNAVEASISPAEKTAWEEAGLTVPDIKYYGIGGTADPANNAAPTEIGKYTAKITPDNIVFATKDFEIIDPNAGGKVTIHRYLRPDKKDWLITCNEKEIENLKAAGWKDEGALGFAGTKDTGVEVIRFYNEITGDRMYTSNEKEKQNYRDAKKYGWIEEGVAFYTGNKAKIVRYTTPTLSHLWSVSIEEQSRLDAHESDGWKKEGVAFYLN